MPSARGDEGDLQFCFQFWEEGLHAKIKFLLTLASDLSFEKMFEVKAGRYAQNCQKSSIHVSTVVLRLRVSHLTRCVWRQKPDHLLLDLMKSAYAAAGWLHEIRQTTLSGSAPGGEKELCSAQEQAGDLHAAGNPKKAADEPNALRTKQPIPKPLNIPQKDIKQLRMLLSALFIYCYS